MRCIFCKKDSSKSTSIEHIISESLGNKRQTLPKGIVCDACNNYFAHKIEKIVLEMPYFVSLKGRKMIENKKGNIPWISGFTEDKNTIDIRFLPNEDNIFEVKIKDEKTIRSIQASKELYIPLIASPQKDDLYISKFIGKIALEALAKRVSSIENWHDDFVDNEGLDELRYFVRFGKGCNECPYNVRRIYSETQISYDKNSGKIIEKMNEYDFFIPDNPSIDGELHTFDNFYFVMAILGIEYTINLTNAGIGRYLKWLEDNGNKSILQMEKSEFHSNLNI